MSTVNAVHVYREGPLVFSPGARATVSLVAENQGDGPARVWYADEAPAGWAVIGSAGLAPVELAPEGRVEVTFTLVAPKVEGPALLAGTFTVQRPELAEASLRLETPIACYGEHPVDAPEGLMEVRERLVAVTNFHPGNGHELMIDPCEYFHARLNVPLSKPLQRLVANEFVFAQAGLPVERGILVAVRRGDLKGVLAVDHILLEADFDDPCDTLQEQRYSAAYPREVRA